MENFRVDTAGRIYVASGAELRYSVTPEYILNAVATNHYGNSDKAKVLIKVFPITGIINLPENVENIAISGDGTKVYTANGSSGMKIIDLGDRVTLQAFLTPKSLQEIVLIEVHHPLNVWFLTGFGIVNALISASFYLILTS